MGDVRDEVLAHSLDPPQFRQIVKDYDGALHVARHLPYGCRFARENFSTRCSQVDRRNIDALQRLAHRALNRRMTYEFHRRPERYVAAQVEHVTCGLVCENDASLAIKD